MKFFNLPKFFLFGCLVLFAFSIQAQTAVSGTVTDGNEPLIGATVLVAGSSTGTVTDFDGTFSLNVNQDPPFTLDISYTGYKSQSIEVAGVQSGLAITLESGATLIDEVVVSASRRKEKAQDAPSSISVLNARKLEASPNNNPVRNLVNTAGVTVQQQSAGRLNIQLRGDGGIFGSATFPIQDYRSLSGPGLGTFDVLNSPVSNVDVDRIEVVRGPGSALYGPGVTAGVVHFITKSAIDKPGTTIELVGGELATFGASVRHATKVSDKFGFKINGVYKRGDEFTLDPDDERDAATIASFKRSVVSPIISNGVVDVTQPGKTLLTEADLDPDGDGNMMQDFWDQKILNATLEFRPADDMSIVASGGYNNASAVFFNSQGEGLSQATETWGQVRFQKGGLFAQAFVLNNDGGSAEKPTFLYRTGNSTGIARRQLEGQLQYNFDLPNILSSNWTAGLDYRSSTADTGNEVYGRNEADDDFNIIGAYLQGKFQLAKKLDFVVAGRADKFNFLDDLAVSPRAVLVFKPSPSHTIRGGFNRAVGAPTQLQVNIDFPVNVPIPGAFDIWLYGNKVPQTFGDNPQIVFNGAFPVPSLPVGTPGLPNAYTYGAVSASAGADPTDDLNFVQELVAGLAAQLVGGGVDPDQAAAVAGAIGGYLADPANTPGGVTGSFVGINLFNGEPLGLINAPAATLRTEDTWEVGYKGLIANKLGVSLDIYNRKVDGATLFTAISPSWTLQNANYGADLGAAVEGTGIRDFIYNTLGGDNAPDPAVAAATADALTAGIVGAYTAGGDAAGGTIDFLSSNGILATTPTEQMPGTPGAHLAAGYRTFEAYSYTGLDLGLEYYVNNDLSIFANYSWISDNIFEDLPVIGADGATTTTSLSAPKNKFRIGANYTPEFGLRGNIAFQHDDSYLALLGLYSGDTDVKNLVDLGVGYKLKNGLSFNISAQNLFNSEYRQFPGFPPIGRRVLGTVRYTFGDNKE